VTTTAVFAEIIVVGLEAEAWIALIVLAIWGPDWVDLDALEPWSALVTILVMAAAYALGIIVDRLADRLVTAVAKTLANSQDADAVTFEEQRLRVLKESDGMAKFLDYQRSRQRVARGTIVNAACTIPAVIAFLWVQTDASGWWVAGGASVAALVLLGAAYANERIFKAYTKNLETAYRLARE
jgi:hypothetical protein